MIDSIDHSKKYRTKIGEKLSYLIEKSDDWEKAELLSVFFNEFLRANISYETFLKISKVIERVTIYDLKIFKNFVKNNRNNYFVASDLDEDCGEVGDLINSGLFRYYVDAVRVEDETDWKMERKYKVEGGELVFEVSFLGKTIYEVLIK